jgi:regulator of CtrA degradation
MNKGSCVEGALAPRNVTVSFGERFQASEQFDIVFREGMALVERVAAYLEGPGRAEAKQLPAPANVLYAAESMRLTTRLLDLASWLLVRRAVKHGDMSEAEANSKRQAGSIEAPPARTTHVLGFGSLPETLRALIAESYSLHDRIVRLDRALAVKLDDGSAVVPSDNPVGQQMDRLRVAFSN